MNVSNFNQNLPNQNESLRSNKPQANSVFEQVASNDSSPVKSTRASRGKAPLNYNTDTLEETKTMTESMLVNFVKVKSDEVCDILLEQE